MMGTHPAWKELCRRYAATQPLEALTWPDRKAESWNWSRLERLEKAILSEQPPLEATAALRPAIFFDGIGITGTPVEGVKCSILANAPLPESPEDRQMDDFSGIATPETSPFAGLVMHGSRKVMHIRVAAGTQATLSLVHCARLAACMIQITCEENSRLHLIEEALPGARRLYNGVTRIEIQKGARLERWLLRRQWQAGATLHSHVRVSEEAEYHFHGLSLGDDFQRHEHIVSLEGNAAKCAIADVLAPCDSHSELLVTLEHKAPSTSSVIRVRHAGLAKSRAFFIGDIRIPPGIGAQGNMDCKSVLLATDARFMVRPQLNIAHDDVVCAHGAAIGGLDTEQIFALLARGISPERARFLLLAGFLQEMLPRSEAPFSVFRSTLDEALYKAQKAQQTQ